MKCDPTLPVAPVTRMRLMRGANSPCAGIDCLGGYGSMGEQQGFSTGLNSMISTRVRSGLTSAPAICRHGRGAVFSAAPRV